MFTINIFLHYEPLYPRLASQFEKKLPRQKTSQFYANFKTVGKNWKYYQQKNEGNLRFIYFTHDHKIVWVIAFFIFQHLTRYEISIRFFILWYFPLIFWSAFTISQNQWLPLYTAEVLQRPQYVILYFLQNFNGFIIIYFYSTINFISFMTQSRFNLLRIAL